VLEGYQAFREAWTSGWAPPPDLSISDWAEEFRYLQPGTSQWSGPWRTHRFPFLRGIMEALSTKAPHERVVVMKGIQMGATEALLNWLGHSMHLDPGPALLVLPSISFMQRYVPKRVDPMIEWSPALRDRVTGTTSLKQYEGGDLAITWSSSPSALSGDSIRFLAGDEVDRWTVELEDEGDVLDLAEGRTTNYEANRKIGLFSSPTVRGRSRIEKVWNQSDKRKLYVPCVKCGHWDFITWRGFGDFVAKKDPGHFWIFFDREAHDRDKPATARMVCPKCDQTIEPRHKTEMLEAHQWRPTIGPDGLPVGDGRTAGFHLPSLYSPVGMTSWGRLVREFVEREKDPPRLRTWINTRLGETYEETVGQVLKDTLLSRRRPWKAEVPHGVGAITMSADLQDAPERLVYQVEGFGAGEQNWKLEHDEIIGSINGTKIWHQLDRMRERGRKHESGRIVRVDSTLVDSRFRPDDVFRYCKARAGRWVFAVRGVGEKGRELVMGHSNKNAYRARVYNMSTDSAADTIQAYLEVDSPGPGYINFPEPDPERGLWLWCNEEFMEQMLAENRVRRWTRRWGWSSSWENTSGRRNEATDLSRYCLAALRIRPALARDLEERAKEWSKPLAEGEVADPLEAPDDPPPRATPRRNWMKGWRG
jgi:phage terminase large subunit GpA-like protein